MTGTETTLDVPRLRVEGLTKSFFGVRVLDEISFDAYAGEVLGVVGENGSGKSTAMNILAGVLSRDGGSVLFDGATYSPRSRRESDAAGVAFIQQELNIFPNLSVAENLFLGRSPRLIEALPIISRAKMRAHTHELLRAVDLDVNPSAPASTLSAGERQLLEIARGLSTDARAMIFDEPTTSLTRSESKRLFEIIERLRGRGVAVIYVSHTLEDVLHLSDRILVLRDGRVTMSALGAGVTADSLVVAMVGRSIETLFPARPPRLPVSAHALEVNGVAEPGVVDDITFGIEKGEIVGLAGLMGSGRSELARILFGLDPHSSGTVRVDSQALSSGDLKARIAAGVAFLTEDRRHDGLMMDASVAENLALAALPLFARRADGRIREKGLMDAIQALAKRLNVKSGNLRSSPVRTLSGGNQQKVVLGRWLLRELTLFILDEPTRGVDVGAKEEIYRLLSHLADSGMGILVISSEIEELTGLCDRILVMRRGRLQAEFNRAGFDCETILKSAFGQGRAR
jgi:ribose transport system ATP-binding protein